MQTISKMHEKNVQNTVHVEKVDTILSDVENVPFALRGATVKTILYWLFSVIAAAELSAAFFFYISSFEMPQVAAAVISVVLAFFLHGLIHAQLTDTAKGMVFSKSRVSKAMSAEVKINIVLSIILLIFAAFCVFFLGKKGYTAFREMKYQTAMMDAKSKSDVPKGLAITADMLTSKRGKISTDRLEQATALVNASAKATEATTTAATAEKLSYDKSTGNITDVVGSSAFILEVILGLLAYAIATAKFAATFDEIARRSTKENVIDEAENGEKATKNTEKASVTANVEASVEENTATRHSDQEQPPQPKKSIGFQKQNAIGNEGRTIVKGFQQDSEKASVGANIAPPSNTKVCCWCDEYFIYSIHNQKYCCEDCRVAAYQARSGKILIKGLKK